jgi:hypothetical protein
MGTGYLSGDKVACDVRLITDLDLVSRLKMLGALPPLPDTPYCRGA